MPPARAQHARGLTWAFCGVLLVSPDTLILRLTGADAWTLLFWRGFITLGAYTLLLLLLPRKTSLAGLLRLDLTGLATAVLYAASSVMFVLAVSLTSVANTPVIFSAGPLFAALFSVAFAREALPTRTWVAAVFAGAGIGIVFAGEIHGDAFIGNLCALGSACAMAATFVLMRHTGKGRMLPLLFYSSLTLTIMVWPFAAPGRIDTPGMSILTFQCLVLIPVSVLLLMGATRLIPAPEVNLVLLLETLLGPLWVWLALGEQPGLATLLGGGLLIGTLSVHAAVSLRGVARAREDPDSAAFSRHP